MIDISGSKITFQPDLEESLVTIDNCDIDCLVFQMSGVRCQITDAVFVSTGQKINLDFTLGRMDAIINWEVYLSGELYDMKFE